MASTHDREPANAAEALERLDRWARYETSMERLLQAVAEVTAEVMPGDAEASISVSIGHVPTTVVSTGPLAFACDESQYGRGDGPCLHAARTGEVTEIADMQAETRWPAFVQEAAERGVLSSLSIPLPMSAGISASLNIYARRPHAFDEASRAAATRVAPYAAVAVTNMRAYRDARDLMADVARVSRSGTGQQERTDPL